MCQRNYLPIYYCPEKTRPALLDRDLSPPPPSPQTHTHFLVLGRVRPAPPAPPPPSSSIYLLLYLVHYLGEGGWDAKTPSEGYTDFSVGQDWDQTGGTHFICFCHHVKFDPSLFVTFLQRFRVCTVCSRPVYQLMLNWQKVPMRLNTQKTLWASRKGRLEYRLSKCCTKPNFGINNNNLRTTCFIELVWCFSYKIACNYIGYPDLIWTRSLLSPHFLKISADWLVAVQAYAELEPDTPGTIQGLTYALGGKKIVLADPSGLVTAVR